MPRLIRSRYEPIEVIGRGGQGQVVRAIDTQHDRPVALKVRHVGSEADRQTLLSEARILLGLRPHASLPLVREDFFVRDRYYLVMDWVEGENLQRVLELRGDPGLPVSTVLGYLTDAAAALDHLHAHRPPIVHGDVKPANLILRPDGHVVLVDFGIAALGGGGPPAMGTPHFTAPEVAAGAEPGPPADVYALGATAYALLTGAPPLGDEPRWEGLGRASAAAAERAIRRALSTDPARRPGSARELVERLRSWHDTALPTGVVTFLLTDIEGSTALWERDPDAMRAALARHNELVGECVERHGGRLIQERGEGDSTFSVFERATDGVSCALDVQRRLGSEPWPAGISLRARISVHTGEAELREGDYTGTTTNRSARIRSLACGGQILLSQTTAGLVRGSLPADAALVDLGERDLKGLTRGEQIFELAHPDLAGEVSAAPSVPKEVAAIPLPQPATTFVGRRVELDGVAGLLSDARLLTLSGPGGTGKTRLALELARMTEERFPHGVFFVDLSPIAEPGGVSRTVAAAVGVLAPLVGADRKEATAATRAINDHLREFLTSKSALLVLDNCEHLREECAKLCDALLRACPSLSILATSREVLHVAGERAYPVRGLTAPSKGADLKLLLGSDAVRLFVERARAVVPGFELRAEDAASVGELCRRLDGLPLAIELVVARLPVLTVSEIVQHLDDVLRGVPSADPGTPVRHRSLEAAIRWSHDLLDDQERALFRRLAVFVGGATFEALERVCAGAPVESGDVLDTLQGLVEKSLVLVDQSEGSPSRYRFLDTVRRFALDRLRETGEWDNVFRRHRDHFQSLIPPALPGTSFDMGVLPIVEAERDNIRGAFRWSIQSGEAEIALWMAIGQYWYWRAAGLSPEIQGWIDEALPRTADDSPLRANALLVIGTLAMERLDYTRALALWEECLPIFRSSGNRSGVGWALLVSGRVHGLRNDHALGDRLFEKAIESFEAEGDTFGAQWARSNWAWLALERGDDALAVSLCEQIMAADRDGLPDEPVGTTRFPVGTARFIDGILEALRGNLSEARALWDEGLSLSADDLPERQWFHLYIGGTELCAGDSARAREQLRDSLQLAKQTGLLEAIPWSLELAAAIAGKEGASTEAARLFGAARRLEREAGFTHECVVWASPLREARRALERSLGKDRAERERSAGERMTVSAAVDLALEVLGRVPESTDVGEPVATVALPPGFTSR